MMTHTLQHGSIDNSVKFTSAYTYIHTNLRSYADSWHATAETSGASSRYSWHRFYTIFGWGKEGSITCGRELLTRRNFTIRRSNRVFHYARHIRHTFVWANERYLSMRSANPSANVGKWMKRPIIKDMKKKKKKTTMSIQGKCMCRVPLGYYSRLECSTKHVPSIVQVQGWGVVGGWICALLATLSTVIYFSMVSHYAIGLVLYF